MRESPPLTYTDLLYRSHEEIRALQNQRFRHQIALCFRAHPYYQEVFRRLKLTPEDFQMERSPLPLPGCARDFRLGSNEPGESSDPS